MRSRQGPWSAELVYSHLTVRDSDAGKDVPHAFADTLLLTAGYRIRSIDIDLSWRLDRYFAAPDNPPRNSGNQVLIDQSFNTYDVFVGWRPHAYPGFTINGGVHNAFDHKARCRPRPSSPGFAAQFALLIAPA